MVRMGFAADSGWLAVHRDADLSAITSVDLEREILPGDQIFEVSGVSLSFIGKKIPLLEFALGLYMAVRSAASYLQFGATHPLDHEEQFRFRREGEIVTVAADVTDAAANCSLSELQEAVRRNCTEILEFLFSVHPEARQNKELYRWYAADELGLSDLFDPAARDEH
jgi:hypothetical protein